MMNPDELEAANAKLKARTGRGYSSTELIVLSSQRGPIAHYFSVDDAVSEAVQTEVVSPVV